MDKEYDKRFNSKIGEILEDIYNNKGKGKGHNKEPIIRGIDRHYIDYILELKLALMTNEYGKNNFGLEITGKGIEVFEKYDSWSNYKKKVLDKKEKVQNAKDLATRYWWLPLLISVVALIFSGIALLTN